MSEVVAEFVTEYEEKFAASAEISGQGKFDILCITAGKGNGWEFTAEVLQESVPLWFGAPVFIDHALSARSIRDFAGNISDPVWDEEAQGIRAALTTFGPGGDIINDFAKYILTVSPPPKVGFSADIVFSANKRKVKKILKVISLDLVYDPARGGAFLRAQEQSKGKNLMENENEKEVKKGIPPKEEPVLEKLQADQEAMRLMLGEQERQSKLAQALEEAKKTRLQMCGYLLESGLNASKLPKPIQDRIRAQFDSQIFEAGELQKAIEDSRKMLSELSEAQYVSGPGRISGMFNETDKLQAAVDDLFEAPREESAKGLKVPRLSGVRELYLTLTGDHDLHGGYYPERIHLATTADFTGLVKNALNKIVVNTWEMLGRAGYDWWMDISTQEHFTNLNQITGTLVGTVGTLPVVAEGAEYTELVIGDSPETADFVKYGGYIPLTLELIDRDETRKLKAYARELGSAGLRRISSLVAAIFTDNAGIGPTMADGGALFNATAVNDAGGAGHANLLTTALAIAAWETVCTAVYNQPMLIKHAAGYYGTGPKMALNPKFCLVPRALQNTAWQMLKGEFVREATYTYDNVLKGSAVPVTVPEWTDATDWAAVCDPVIAPAIYVGERFGIMPEIYVAGDELSPAVFMNDEHRLKVRHFLAVWVNDFRPLHKSNVA